MERKDENTVMGEMAGAHPEDSVLGLYSVIEESARLLEIPCSREKVLPILSAYGDDLPEAVIAFRVATSARHAGELDCRFSVPQGVDPYELAVSNGFIARTDHPVADLLSDIRGCCPIDSYGIDFGVVGGFKKIWLVLPRAEVQTISKLAGIPSMPRSLGESADFFARHRIDDGTVGLLGIDYQYRTVNVYIGELPAECFEPETIRSMIREVDQADPSEQMLKIGHMAFGIYVTLNWDSPKLERICFAVGTSDPTELPVPLDPVIVRFVRHIQRSNAGRRFVYAVASSPNGEYYKLQSYYQWRPEILDIMQLSPGATKDLV
jgi:6-linalyl-2-O,3-dimethylflaviolin/7-geranyloxy-5-hydroxy-2-methoxy-3-methylnaphthalene-1,4-dione synthase